MGGRQVSTCDPQHVEENALNSLFQDFASNMVAIGKNLNQNKLLECVNLIKKSNQVHIVAVGNTSQMAQYMGFRLGRLGIRCTYSMIPEYFFNHINLADAGDIIIAISQSGSSKQVVQAMELGKERGLKIIAITAYECSPVSRLADYLLLSSANKKPLNYYNDNARLSELAVVDALLHFVINEDTIIANSDDKLEFLLSEYKL